MSLRWSRNKLGCFSKTNSAAQPIIKVFLYLTKTHRIHAARRREYISSLFLGVCTWVSRGAREGRKYGSRTQFSNPRVRPPSLNLSLLSTLVTTSVTPQTSQLSHFLTVKVLTNREGCQYGGPVIRVWLAHESCHTCVLVGASSTPCVMAGLRPCEERTWWWANRLNIPGLSATHTRCRWEQSFGFGQRGADTNPADLIPISGGPSVCFPDLAFVRETE